MLLRCLPLLFVVTLSACGGKTTTGREDVNRVYERAMQAVHAADWAALEKELTKNARFLLQQDLERLSRRLAHPEDGTREREIAAARLGADADAAIQKAAGGSMPDVLAFFVRLSPRDPVPPRRSFQLAQFTCKIDYALQNGERRTISFARKPDGWYVSELQL